MSQTSVIFGALLVGFVVYVTSRGQLPAYLAVLGFGGSSSNASTSSNPQTALNSQFATAATASVQPPAPTPSPISSIMSLATEF
jgi:hypothetical protein